MKNSNLIFLIGAARSGTKMLRDVLATHPEIAKVPYDINFIWRIGNEKVSHDELTESNFSNNSHKQISDYLNKYNSSTYLIEKTVSNTIRIPFLLKHYPEAKFIFLYREGLDVCESVLRQWKESPDKDYLLKKIGHIPIKQLLSYGMKFLYRNLLGKSDEFYWGVNYPRLSNDLKVKQLEEIVAVQWKYCVSKMMEDKYLIPDENLIEVYYEDLVETPEQNLSNIIKFIDDSLDIGKINIDSIKTGNVGKGLKNLTENQIQTITSIIDAEMNKLGYSKIEKERK